MSEVYVELFDTTLRDGAQSLPNIHQFKKGNKPYIAEHIARLGVAAIEAGFPATPGDEEEVNKVAQSIGCSSVPVQVWRNGEHTGDKQHYPVIVGLSRTKHEDIEAAWRAVSGAIKPRIHTFISTDAEHMRAKFPGKRPDEVLRMGIAAVKYAKSISSENRNATVEFSAEAASTTDLQYLERTIKAAVDAGADIINVPDTVGQRDPLWMQSFYSKVLHWVHTINPVVTVSAHNHNDLGMAVANSISLVHAASRYAAITAHDVRVQLETTICGLGERAGNADIFPVLASIFKFSDQLEVPVNWISNPEKAVKTASAVMHAARLTVDRQNPIVGRDILVHRSGIHSDGVIKGGHSIYTPYNPRFWGHDSSAVHEDGRYQGKKGREHANRHSDE